MAPPAATAPIQYSALGASDANGVGSSVPCVPFDPCPDGTGYVPVLARQLRTSRDVTLMNLGIPASVLSPAIETLARQHGQDGGRGEGARQRDQEAAAWPARSGFWRRGRSH